MTDYNDGKWHGWNGGECPVHPKSEIDVRWLKGSTSCDGLMASAYRDGCWSHDDPLCNHIIAFRVVEPYREPREGWAVRLFTSAREAKIAFPGSEPFKVREVTE